MSQLQLRPTGILPPITTPFNDRGDVDLDALAHNIERYNAVSLTGFVAFGSNGEAAHLNAEEQHAVLTTVHRHASPGRLLVAGINQQSTRAAIAAIVRTADAGADAALVLTPYFYKGSMTQDVLRAFFLDVAEASPLPFVLYNIPQNTGVTLSSQTISELAAHPRIIGLKDSAGNLGALGETLRLVGEDFTVLVGNAGIFYPALMMGAHGAVLAVACLAPEVCVDILHATGNGEHERARELQQRLAPLGHLVTAGLGVAGLKASLDLAGWAGGQPRRPLLGISEGERLGLREAMRKSGFFPRLEKI